MKKSPEKMARGSGIKYVKLVNKIYFQLRFFTACIHTVESLNCFFWGGGESAWSIFFEFFGIVRHLHGVA